MPARLLLRGQWRRRAGRQLWLGAALALGLLAFFLVGMALAGAEESVVEPLRATVVGDVRVTQGSVDMAGGEAWPDARGVLERLRAPGVVAAPRLEASHVTVREDQQDNWTAGLLLGIDARLPAEQAALADRLVWGTVLPAGSLLAPDGRAVVPLLLGEPAARRLGVVGPGPDFAHPLKLSSGRFAGRDALPITADAVVVGVYRSGLEPLDRFTAFAPIGDVRHLVGGNAGDPSANAIVLHGAGADAGQAEAALAGLPGIQVQGARAFAQGYMGGLLAVLGIAGGLALALFTVVLGVWLLHEVATQLSRDAGVVAGLRAIGLPFRSIVAAYAGLSVATVGAAALAAAVVAVLVSWLAPSVSVETGGLQVTVAWRLRAVDLAWSLLAAVALAAAATWLAARRLARVNVAEALRS
ncbi:MAG: hypothetical protein QOD77_1352 [Thermoplasmata archaeon]|nr:hypothetical protein [Thermoplasmata archaeon]